MIIDTTSNFLPGVIHTDHGSGRDYRTLERFHYVPVRPATFAGVWVARYAETRDAPRVIAIAVLSYPSAVQRTRHRVFGLESMTYRQRLLWANAHLRTISRVIVHPQFRSIGLAQRLIQTALHECPTRYVEASARMGRAHPLFQSAGMLRVDPESPDNPVYYWFDRTPGATNPNDGA